MENLVNARILSSFYREKKVFITGHTGFKGSWLLTIMKSFGAIIKGYALEPEYSGGLFDYVNVSESGESVINDIRNKEALQCEILNFQPDFVFHLAAQPLVRKSYTLPADTFDINATGTAVLLECVLKLEKKCAIVVVTSDKVYQNKERDILYTENDALGGHDPYSSSKACAELVVESFRRSYFNYQSLNHSHITVATARAGNVIGGGDWSDSRILPDIINSLTENRPILIRNPNAIRPWQHVLEALAGYLYLGMKLYKDPSKYSKAYNFGPLEQDHLPVRQFVECAISLWGSGSWQDISDPSALHEAGILKLNITRAMTELGWLPKLHADQAIDWSISWYKCGDLDKLNFTHQQIENYFSL